jgi:CNT family concentrative nucleoside transporter
MQYIQILIGFIGLIALAIPFSNNIKLINYKHLVAGIAFQIFLALLLLKASLITSFFTYLADGVEVLKVATKEGTIFMFGYLGDPADGMIFAFHILPFIIVMSCLTAILWYWGVLPILVKGFSIVCQKLFNIGGPIGLGGAANVFVGQVEAPLLIRPYLKDLSKKELLILMTTGMATVAGSVMIALVSILDMKFEGINLIQHFLIASILSVPAAIVYANIMIPSNHITDFESSETPRVYESTMDAITRGTSDGMNIALSVGSIVLAFIALVFIADSILGLIPISLGGEDLSLKLILGYMFAPIAWMMGIPWDEALISGKLLGTKTALNEFVAYLDLAALSEGALSDRSRLITLYGLCGFANFSSIGILVAGISAMAPEKKPELIEVSLKALVGATLASCMTGLVLSLFI